ncbi:MAG: hypothetical protein C5B51_26650 [Terriglobia bacterium]|nr:MAG: hypothetical protein C5B51_26650 [Terriglobia bacterium]
MIPLGGTPSDIVLDESRQRLYLVNSPGNRVDVYDYAAQAVIGSIGVGQAPLAAALSIDNAFLYVTNHDSSSLSVVSLTGPTLGDVINTVALPAKPEGVEVGADGRVLICTDGSGTNNAANTLVVFDGNQTAANQVLPVAFPPPAPTPAALAPISARAVTQFNGRLQRTPNGRYIIGVSATAINTAGNQVVAYVYEAASGTMLLSRTLVSQSSSTLSMAPDGASFMAGATLYDSSTLNVIGQQSNANAPFPMSGINTATNQGGSVFSPDGKTLYSVFNVAPNTNPPAAPQASTLLISDQRTLTIRLGINLPENVLGRMVITSDGNDIWALSSSGIVHLPIGKLYDYPILMPDTTTVFLAQDDCNLGIAQAAVRINNIGGGTLTFAVPTNISGGSAALVVTASSGLAPANVMFTMDPGRSAVIRTPGTNLYTGGGSNNQGNAVNVSLVSSNAINIPPSIRVFMNYRDSTMRGIVYPIPTAPNSTAAAFEGLQDIALDEARNRVYITNSGYNRIEVFDTKKMAFQAPIAVGQLPHQMAMGLDGSTLYVANTGSETVATVDLDQQQVTGYIQFPPIPRTATNVTSVQGLSIGLSGLQMVRSDGNLWRVVGNQAVPRVGTSVTGVNAQGQQTAIAGPARTMLTSDDGSYGVLLGSTGMVYLYDGLRDAYTLSSRLFGTTNNVVGPGIPGGNAIIGYYGPLGVAPRGNFLLANGLVTNQGLSAIGGAASPGQVTITFPTQPGQFPTVGVTSTGLRNVAAVSAVDQNLFLRMTTAVRNNLTAATSDDIHTTLEAVDTRTGATAMAARMPENPVFSEFGTTRVNIPSRHMVVDSKGTVYAVTVSGLSVVPLTPANTSTQPAIAATNSVVNASDGSANFKPGSFININGTSLAATATADTLPPPTVLGGSCVLVDGVALPLLSTSAGQISAQIPASIRPGLNVVQVRSLATAQQSNRVVVTIQKP